MLSKINKVNERISKYNQRNENYSPFFNQIFDGIMKKNDPKHSDELSPSQTKLIIESRKNPSSLKPDICEYANKLDLKTGHVENSVLMQNLPSNDDYFFMSAIKRKNPETLRELNNIAVDYNISAKEIAAMKEKGLIDYLSNEEQSYINKIRDIDGSKINGDLFKKLDDFKKRGLVDYLSKNENRFLKDIKENQYQEKSISLSALQYLHDISSTRYKEIKRNGFLDILSEKQVEYLNLLEKRDVNLPELSIQDKIKLKERIKYKDNMQIKDVDLSSISDASHIQYLSLSKENNLSLKERSQLAKDLHINTKEKGLLDNRFKYYESRTVEHIDYSTRCNFDKITVKPVNVKYYENQDVREEREHLKCSYEFKIKAIDTTTMLESLSSNDLSNRLSERLSELKSHNIKIDDIYIPTNSECSFLEKVNGRKLDDKTLNKIAIDDFNMKESDVENLFSKQFLEKRSGKIINKWQDPKILHDARTWLHSSHDTRIKLCLKRPPKEVLKLLDIEGFQIGTKQIDYELHFKMLRNERLSDSENLRTMELERNGQHPLSKRFKDLVHLEPDSWKLKMSRKRAFLSHYNKEYGVNFEALEFINKFKQVTHDQLLNIGLSEEDINRYSKGTKEGMGSDRLIQKHILKGEKPIHYYSITHEGPISGRSFLETRLNKEDIAKKTQSRRDLLYHDLKVVDCVLKVKEEYERKGFRIKEIKNESTHFSEAKKGKMNHERQGGPAFMDATIVVEEIKTQGGGSSSGEKMIAVEYGNYSLDRMSSKLQNSTFDHAHVFAKPEYIQRYQSNIFMENISFSSML